MEFELKDVLYIIITIGSVVATHFVSRHKFREEFDKKIKELNDKIDLLKSKDASQDVELEKLRSKDELQGQVIDQIKGQMDLILVQLFDALKEKGGKK